MSTTDRTVGRLLDAVHALEPVIRRHADEAEGNHRLSAPVVNALVEAELFRMWVPQSLGGLELPPLSFYRVVEAVARLDGSTGWCLFIGGSSAATGAHLGDAAAERIFGDPRTIVAGSIAGVGKAEMREGGYLVNGRWPYASGCQHATWMLALCQVVTADQPRPSGTGGPELRLVHLPVEQTTILGDTWDVSGLVGTGSHDFTIEEVFVPETYTWSFAPGNARGKHYGGPLYRFPMVGLFRLPVSAVALGIAQGTVDACRELLPAKRSVIGTGVLRDQPHFLARLAEATALTGSARAWLHAAIQRAWDAAVATGSVSLAERGELHLAALNATRRAAEAVQIVYTLAGGSANYRRSPLQRSLRDVSAVTQHVGMAPQQYEDAGRMLLGSAPLQLLLQL